MNEIVIGRKGEKLTPRRTAPHSLFVGPQFDVLDEDVPHEVLLTKSQSWSFERERRLIAQERAHARSAEGLLCENGSYPLQPGEVKTVIVGSFMAEPEVVTVLKLVRESGEDIVVQRAVLSRDQYALTFRRIN